MFHSPLNNHERSNNMKIITKETMFSAMKSAGKGVKACLIGYDFKDENTMVDSDLGKAADIFANLINAVNQLDQYQNKVNGIDLDDIQIPLGFDKLLLPKSVKIRIDGFNYPDLRLRDEGFCAKEVRLADLAWACGIWTTYNKGKESGLISISSVPGRADTSLADVIDRVEILDGSGLSRCNTTVTSAILIPISADIEPFYPSAFFKGDSSEVENLYFVRDLVEVLRPKA